MRINMGKSVNQKMKMLYIIKILSEQTDAKHPMPMASLIDALAQYDIKAERKSIYDDVACLNDFGYKIVLDKSKTHGGYYLNGREFELPELKLLVDAVQASRFLTVNKSRELISKIEKLSSKADAVQLQRQVYVANRIKTANESIYYIVDDIHTAIQNNKQIQFQYLEWNTDKELVPRHDGKYYQVSPFALTCKDENYYLIAHDTEVNKIKHFRVDKMGKIEILEDTLRTGNELFQQVDIAEYTNKTFGMFGGDTETVRIEIDRTLIGVIIDRFGKDISIRPKDENSMLVRVNVALSGQFFGWITGLGGAAKIIGPEKVVKDYQQYLQNILNNY